MQVGCVPRRAVETEARAPKAEKPHSFQPSKGLPPLPGQLGGSQGTGARASLPTHRAALGKSYLPVPQSLPVLPR